MIVFEDRHVLTEPLLDWLSRDDDFTKYNSAGVRIIRTPCDNTSLLKVFV